MISVVLPCFNERASIGRYEAELFPALDRLGQPYEIVAVDDGSKDGSGNALAGLTRKHPVVVLAHERNRGLGAALRTGFAACQGQLIATLDADLTFAPSQLAALLACQKETGADLVAGSPFLDSKSLTAVPWSRRLPSLFLNAFFRGLFSRALTAYTPIFRLYRAAALKPLLGALRSDGFEINAELAALFVRRRLSVAEAPAVLTARTEGVSKLARGREALRYGRLALRLLFSNA